MESLLVKFYTMTDEELENNLENKLTVEEAEFFIGETKKCIEAIKNAKVLYNKLAEYEKKFSAPLTVLWCFINPFAKKKLLSEYNKVRDEAISIWKNPDIVLEQLIDAEIDAIVAENQSIERDKERNALIHLALLRVGEKMANKIIPNVKARID